MMNNLEKESNELKKQLFKSEESCRYMIKKNESLSNSIESLERDNKILRAQNEFLIDDRNRLFSIQMSKEQAMKRAIELSSKERQDLSDELDMLKKEISNKSEKANISKPRRTGLILVHNPKGN